MDTILATTTAMASPMAMGSTATMDTPTLDTSDTTTARGLLMPSLLLMLMPTMAATTATLLWLLSPVCPPSMEVLCMVSPRSPTVSMATTMARGPLMLSPLLSLPLKLMPMPSTTMAMPTTDAVSTMATLLPTMDTMDTSATTDTPTCTTATTDTITNLLIFVKN